MFERKAFGLIQSSQQTKLSLTGGKIQVSTPSSSKKRKFIDENDTPQNNVRKDGLYEDASTPQVKRTKLSKCTDTGVQTDISLFKNKNKSEDDSNEIVDMLTSDKPSEKYWELLALERKTALTEVLKENKILTHKCDKLTRKAYLLQQQVYDLDEDNSKLASMVKEAEKLAEIVEEIAKSDIEEDDENSASEDESHKSKELKLEDAQSSDEGKVNQDSHS